MSGSLLEQADQLLAAGQRVPAAVIVRIVLERWIRDEAEKNGIANADSEKASSLNDSLKRVGVFSIPKWRQVQTCLDIGNAAAHGKDDQFSADDIRRALEFVRAACF